MVASWLLRLSAKSHSAMSLQMPPSRSEDVRGVDLRRDIAAPGRIVALAKAAPLLIKVKSAAMDMDKAMECREYLPRPSSRRLTMLGSGFSICLASVAIIGPDDWQWMSSDELLTQGFQPFCSRV